MDAKELSAKLRQLADEAGKKADEAMSMDDLADVYCQGQRNAFLKAAELVEEQSKTATSR